LAKLEDPAVGKRFTWRVPILGVGLDALCGLLP